MIPRLTMSGVLPPYTGATPVEQATVSPYRSTMVEFATRFCTSAHRVALFRGLVKLRKELNSLGITEGLQWFDGSFCEDAETNLGRSPSDIDLVTLFTRPVGLTDATAWQACVNANLKLFIPAEAKKEFGCDPYYVDGSFPVYIVANRIAYWFGLFSHQRTSNLWKGMVQIPLLADDEDALAVIDAMAFSP